MRYIIGTRGSKLAMVQSEYVGRLLKEAYPEHDFELKVIKTKGDLIQDRPLAAIGDKGLFTTEIEEQILHGEVHIGVHSMKDMPGKVAEGLCFTKCLKREDPRDALILREKKSLSELKEGAVIGTGSIRRKLQLLKLRPDLKVVDIRGNVDTRLKKMEELKLDGIVLAAAGLSRLGLSDRITQYFSLEEMIPAPAQGILALEVREDAKELQAMVASLSDEESQAAALAERTFLDQIGGDCHVPIGAICTKIDSAMYQLSCMFGNEDGSKTAYTKVTGEDPEKLARLAVSDINSQLSHKVILVGGGPGDPALITVKGLKAIREADCIVYDRLSSPELLDEAKPGCEMIYVGKQNRNHTMRQEQINELLAAMAKKHRLVVRLKGGDVYVFGRGGEEGLFLRENNIPFEIIPGISSSIAGLAYAGIPITHRGIAAGFHVVTAHNKMDELADIDFTAMAKGKDTCVFLMGLTKLKEITEGLMNAGMPASTKAAVISHATTNEQRTVAATLSDIVDKVDEARLSSPALIVVGEVVSLREQLNFFEERPLFGKKYIVPKIGKAHSRLSSFLEEAGAFVKEVEVGTIETLNVNFSKDELSKVNWLVFTSKNGVESFFTNLAASGLDVRSIAQSKVAAIGCMTADALKHHGIIADLVPNQYDSDAFYDVLKINIKSEDRVWYVKALYTEDSRLDLLKNCCNFSEIAVYDNVKAKVCEEVSFEDADGILFTCASSAKRFFEMVSLKSLSADTKIYSIGPKTTAALINAGITDCIEADEASYEALIRKVR